MGESNYVLRARWVIPLSGPPIEGGAVAVRAGRIVGVGPHAGCFSADRVYDLGDVGLLPGFVNAHTHLEFSDLAAPLGSPGMGICEWIKLVVAERRRDGRDSAAAVRTGMAESARWGVTAIGEIAQRDWSADAIESLPLAVNVYLELIALGPERVDELCATAWVHMNRAALPRGRWRPGVSPHAPYSVNRAVVERLAELPLAMHVAESREELELLATATGPMREMLREFGAWREGMFGGLAPVDYLRAIVDVGEGTRLTRLGSPRTPALIVHGNYLDSEAMDALTRSGRPVSVVYCPRTHAFFRHAPYPLAELRRRGVAVAIGTDSRASNPDLNVLAELRFVSEHFSELAAEDVLRMGTLAGAAALGRGDECGSLDVGKSADLAAVAIDGGEKLTPYEQVLRSGGDVVLTIAAGKIVYDGRSLIGTDALG